MRRGTEIVERPAVQTTITRRYTEEAVAFIRNHRKLCVVDERIALVADADAIDPTSGAVTLMTLHAANSCRAVQVQHPWYTPAGSAKHHFLCFIRRIDGVIGIAKELINQRGLGQTKTLHGLTC